MKNYLTNKMKLYPRIAARIYDAPWQMMPSRFSEMSEAFEKVRRNPEWQAADDPVGPYDEEAGVREYDHPQIEVYGSVALARVHGTTGKGLSRMAMMCGGFDTNLFCDQLKNVAEDVAIKTLVIDFNSPGGMAIGNMAVANAIMAVSASGKKTIAYASGQCASAAYWMAAACDEVYAGPDAVVGSISTICSGVDSSKEWEQEGRELKLFSTGKFKATGMPGKAWTKEEEDYIWQRVKLLDDEFKGFIAKRRKLDASCMEGQWWYARFAPEGLVDSTEFESLDSLLVTIFSLESN